MFPENRRRSVYFMLALMPDSESLLEALSDQPDFGDVVDADDVDDVDDVDDRWLCTSFHKTG